ncbi:MAG: endonuclease III [Bacteroidales bacterium]
MQKQLRFEKVLACFSEHQSAAATELVYADAFQLLVAVILSAQCTDKRVNLITPALFGRFPDAKSLAAASQQEVYSYIKSCSYPNNKAKHLVGMAKALVETFDSIVPSDVSALQKLPGVGRKTANVIASVIYNKPAMPVDTHVFRVAQRIGLTTNARTPLQAEKQLLQYIPEKQIPRAHHWLILHGRYICTARKPKCPECILKQYCRFYNTSVTPGT